MKFTVGQYVCHPSYGPGQIVDIEEQTIENAPEKYYVIHIGGQNLTIHIPFNSSDTVGLRSIISKEQTEEVLVKLQKEPQPLPADHKKRQSRLKEQIFSGQPVLVAEAIRSLTWRRFRKGNLNTVDAKLLEQGKEMLVDEVALATGTEHVSALASVNDALWSALENKGKIADR